MRFLKGFGQFWYDFVIGDDWKIALAVLLVLIIGLGFLAVGVADAVLTIGCGLLFLVVFTVALMIDVRS